MGDGGWLSRKSTLLLASITTGFPEEGTVTEQGMGTRKWLDRWEVGGSSQHMGPRGRKASGPGQGEGTQDSPWSRQRAGVGVGVRTGLRGAEVRPQKWGLWRGGGLGGARPQPAEAAARRTPCTRAPPDGTSRVTVSIFFNQFNKILDRVLRRSQAPGPIPSLADATVPIFPKRERIPGEIIQLDFVARARIPTHAFIYFITSLRSPYCVLRITVHSTNRSLALWGL